MTTEKPASRYLLAENWGHIFIGTQENVTRFIYDLEEERIVRAQIYSGPFGALVDATESERADLEDSVKNANSDALENPQEWDLVPHDHPDFPEDVAETPAMK